MTYLPCLLTTMIWARYTDSELLWLFDTPRKLSGHTELISIQGLLHVNLHCNKLRLAGPAPGDQWRRAWPGGGGELEMCLSGKSPNNETPYYCLRAGLLFTEATCGIRPGSKPSPCQTIGPENNTLPRQKPWPLPDCWAKNNTLPRQKLWKTYPSGRHIPSTQSIATSPLPPPPGPLLSKMGKFRNEVINCNVPRYSRVMSRRSQLRASPIYLSSTLTWNNFALVTHMMNIWEYAKPWPLWTPDKIRQASMSNLWNLWQPFHLHTCLYRTSLALDLTAWHRGCCNLELTWGAFHWDVPCCNDRAQLPQNHFLAFIYQFVTLIMKFEHFETVMKRTPGTLLCL